MAELNKSGNITVSDKFLYIEPNDTFGTDNNTPVPLEDLCIYVDLRVEYLPKRHILGKTVDGEEIYLRVVINKDGSKNTFLSGSKIGLKGNKSNMLTTMGYGNYTMSTIPLNGTNELFGVESIDIMYNSYMVPEINIKFIDIKGSALHGAEELVHNSDGLYDGGQEEEISYSRKFLSAFFTVPYPRFELIVKGFYGKPVHYDLTCADFRSSFDSHTGNYTATAKMVGYSFALISDVQMCSLLAAPYSQYIGHEYWINKQNDGTFFVDGVKMPTLQQIVSIWNNKMSKINRNDNDESVQNEIQILKNNISNLNYCVDKITQYIVYLKDVGGSSEERRDYSRTIYDEKNKTIVVISSIEEQNIEKITRTINSKTNDYVYKKNWGDETIRNSYVDDLQNVLGKNYYQWNRIKEWEFYHYKGGETNEKRISFLNEIIIKKEIDNEVSKNILTLYNDLYSDKKDTIEMFVYVISFKDILQKLIYDISKNNQEYLTKQVSVEEELNNELSLSLGFRPTLENISKICFAHLETLLYMFEYVKHKELNKNEEIVVQEKTYNNLFKIFPEYRKKTTIDGVQRMEEAYIGTLLPNKEEIQFVRGMIQGIKDGVDNDDVLPVGVSIDNSDYNRISPIDVIRGVNPFMNCVGGFFNDFLKNRLAELFAIGIQRENVSPKEMGIYDAKNYYKLFPKGYNGIEDDIIQKKWSKTFLQKMNQDVLKEDKKYSNFNKEVNQGCVSLYDVKYNNEEIYKLIYNDNNCDLFKIIDDGSLDGVSMYTWISSVSDTYTINTKGGWGLSIEESCFNFKNYINTLSAYIVPKVLSRNNMMKIPHQLIKKFDNKISVNNDIFNDYNFYDKNDNLKFIIKRNYEENVDKTVDTISEKYKVVSCHSSMNSNKYTILTIPTFDSETGCYNITHGTLFNEERYREENDIYVRAYYFLFSFSWGDEENKEKLLMDRKNGERYRYNFEHLVYNTFNLESNGKIKYDYKYIESLPLFYVLQMGASLFCYKNGYMKYTSENMNRFNSLFLLYQSKTLYSLNENYQNYLINYFKNWVDKTYVKWDSVFIKEYENVVNGRESELYYLTIKRNLQYINLFRDDHWVVVEMTKQFFSLVLLYKYNPVMLKDNNNFDNFLKYTFNYDENVKLNYYKDKPCFGLKKHMEEYLDSFNSTLEELFKDKINKKISKSLNLISSDEYIEFGLYKYLSQIWNRWLVSEKNDYNNWKMTDVINDDYGRVHFIDSSYNKIGDTVLVNLTKFCELIQSCKEQKDMSLLTFLSYFYRDNNCVLYNIQNFYDNQKSENVENIFNPIPFNEIEWDNLKAFSDLIVMFSYHPADSEEDSFNINESIVGKLPEHLQTLIEGNYRVPSIGVTYGAQNQNYFIDISVSMETPHVTDQALQATFRIADENSKNGASDSTLRVRSFGQDQWQVFSNHAYECTVKMMGCAWIQPLMYFQLLNIPLFRGAYIIQKVNHTIQAGQMFTTFSGVKISKKSFKFMRHTQIIGQKNLIKTIDNLSESNKVNVNNDCSYVFYNPYGVNDKTDKRHIIDFEMFMSNNISITNVDGSESINLNNYQIFSLIFYKSASLMVETEKRQLFVQFLVVLFYNYWKRFRDDYMNRTEKLFDKFLTDYSNLYNAYSSINFNETKNFYQTEEKKVSNIVSFIKNMFLKPKEWTDTWAKNVGDVNCIDGLILNDEDYGIKVYQISNYQFIKGAYGDVCFYFNEKNKNDDISELTIQKIVDAFNNTIKETFLLNKINIIIEKEYHNEKEHRALLTIDKNNVSSEIYGGIFDMILQTYSNFLRNIVWVVKDINSSSDVWDYICIELAYNNDFDVKVGYLLNNDTLLTETIDSFTALNEYFYMSLMKKYSIKKDLQMKSFNNLNDDFRKQCKNFNILNSKNSWKTDVLDFFSINDVTKNITIMPCDGSDPYRKKYDYGSVSTMSEKEISEMVNKYDDYQFNGYEGDTHTYHNNLIEQLLINNTSLLNEDEVELMLLRNGLTPIESINHGTEEMKEKMESLGRYAQTHLTQEGSKACAKYVRQALEGALKLSTNGRPGSASRYAQILGFWGFTMIYDGFISQYDGQYLNGDIIVIAGKELQEKDNDGKLINPKKLEDGRIVSANRHPRIGHIQIYYNGKWYADKQFDNANVYKEDRPCCIFRGVDMNAIMRNSNKGNGMGLVIKNGKVYWGSEYIYEENNGGINWQPSSSVLEKIKEFEGWHEGWVKCPSGYLTTGWGFIQTQELLVKYPNGMTKNEADKYFMDVAVPERVRQLKYIMKDMMYYNNRQMDGLFDLLYNIGSHTFKNQSPNMMAALKIRNIDGVIRNMDHGMGSGLQGLIKRRSYDRELFKTNLGIND